MLRKKVSALLFTLLFFSAALAGRKDDPCKKCIVEKNSFGETTKQCWQDVGFDSYPQMMKICIRNMNGSTSLLAEFNTNSAVNKPLPAGAKVIIKTVGGNEITLTSINEAPSRVDAWNGFTTYWRPIFPLTDSIILQLSKERIIGIRTFGLDEVVTYPIREKTGEKIIKAINCINCSECE